MTEWTTFLSESLSGAAVTWQNFSLWEAPWPSWNWASAAANQATGASAQKAGSFRFDIMRRGGGGGKFGGELAEHVEAAC